MGRSPGFGSTPRDSSALFGLALSTAPPHGLTSPRSVTRRVMMQKVRGRTLPEGHSAPTACRRTVSGTISLPEQGFFSPFPHGTCSLSVAGSYLALEDGPPEFPPDCTCPAVLGESSEGDPVSATGLLPPLAGLSRPFAYRAALSLPGDSAASPEAPTTPSLQRLRACIGSVWAVPRSLATTRGIASLLSFPAATKMVQFAAFAPRRLWIQRRVRGHDPAPVSRFGDLRI